MRAASKYCSFVHRCRIRVARKWPRIDRCSSRRANRDPGRREYPHVRRQLHTREDGRRTQGRSRHAIHHAHGVKGIERIRFTHSHRRVKDSLIEAFAPPPASASRDHLHLPVQERLGRVLGVMKRGYTRSEFKDKVRKAGAVRARHAISLGFHSRFPARGLARDVRRRSRAAREVGLDPVRQLPIQQPARHAGGHPCGRDPEPAGQAAALARLQRAARVRARAISDCDWSAHDNRC